MKKVFLGSFYGEELFIEDKNDVMSEKEWQNAFHEYNESEKKRAIERYKNELFLKELENKRPWWRRYV